MAKRRSGKLPQRAWDLVIESTVIVTSTVIATLLLVLVFHVG